jgi:hypothetical protein
MMRGTLAFVFFVGIAVCKTSIVMFGVTPPSPSVKDIMLCFIIRCCCTQNYFKVSNLNL